MWIGPGTVHWVQAVVRLLLVYFMMQLQHCALMNILLHAADRGAPRLGVVHQDWARQLTSGGRNCLPIL